MAKTKKQLEAENRELREENRQLREENRELRELVAELRKRIQDLEAEVKQLKKRRFAPKSERNRTNADPLNGLVDRLTGDFSEDERQRAQELVDLLRTTRDEHRQLMERLKAEGKLKPKAPRNRGGWIPEDLPVRHEYVSVERRCPCGCQRDLVSTQQSERLGYVPGYFERVVTTQPVYRCPACEAFSMPTPLHEPSICGFADASLLAQVVLWKIDDHLPIHRIARLLGRDGVPVPKGTVLGWFFQAATWLEGVAEAVRKQALASGVVYVDDTPITVLDQTREKGSYKGRIWTVCGGPGQIYYRFSEDWKQKHPLALLESFEGTIVGDGYGGYGGIVKTLEITLAGCSAHARRKFWDLLLCCTPNGRDRPPLVATSVARSPLRLRVPCPSPSASVTYPGRSPEADAGGDGQGTPPPCLGPEVEVAVTASLQRARTQGVQPNTCSSGSRAWRWHSWGLRPTSGSTTWSGRRRPEG